jgi:hypothetical protein
MSRSYRRPFAAITGLASAKSDKQMAHRGVRRKQNHALKTCADYENLLPPHRLECHWNDTYCWGPSLEAIGSSIMGSWKPAGAAILYVYE